MNKDSTFLARSIREKSKKANKAFFRNDAISMANWDIWIEVARLKAISLMLLVHYKQGGLSTHLIEDGVEFWFVEDIYSVKTCFPYKIILKCRACIKIG